MIAPPADVKPLIPSTQLLDGNAAQAGARLRAGGWVTLSKALAAEHHLHIGSRLTLPSPRPLTVRVAALTGNIGWPPGAIITTAAEYARGWSSPEPSAYLIRLAPGAKPASVIAALDRATGPGLIAQSAAAHEAQQNTLSVQGLERLSQIAILILAVAVLASAAALASMISQRRPRLAKLKLEGFTRRELWGTVLLEVVVVLALACISGALFGLLAQQLLDRALAQVINFPVVPSLAIGTAVAERRGRDADRGADRRDPRLRRRRSARSARPGGLDGTQWPRSSRHSFRRAHRHTCGSELPLPAGGDKRFAPRGVHRVLLRLAPTSLFSHPRVRSVGNDARRTQPGQGIRHRPRAPPVMSDKTASIQRRSCKFSRSATRHRVSKESIRALCHRTLWASFDEPPPAIHADLREPRVVCPRSTTPTGSTTRGHRGGIREG